MEEKRAKDIWDNTLNKLLRNIRALACAIQVIEKKEQQLFKYNSKAYWSQIGLFIEKMVRNKDILVGEQNLIISHWKKEKSVHFIGKILKLNKSTVFNIIDRFKKTNSVENKQRSGRPRIFNERGGFAGLSIGYLRHPGIRGPDKLDLTSFLAV
ncbi:UNVERIFIED_CONTAM: hypothetical protein NCL1_22115 [Trichonephila clavipes]